MQEKKNICKTYEGTEEYMTQAGYDMIVPFVGEEDSDAEPEIRMVSKLQEVYCFYQRDTEPDREEAIVEAVSYTHLGSSEPVF